ncbi:MAG: GtrA family protein [Patescibacteria group bacterium]
MWQKLLVYINVNKIQMLKYGAVGLTAAIFDFGILIFLTELAHVFYLLSATISFIVSALVNYYLNRFWTFRSRGSQVRQIPIFFVVATIGLGLNNLILWLGVEWVHMYYVVAKVLATAVVMVSNYLGNKYFTFKS